MLALHRIGGYLFIALFCVMGYFMVARLRAGAENSPLVTIHLALALILSPLLFIKVLVARYYKAQQGLLMPIGITIFVLSFVLIASTAGPYLARATRIEQVSIDPATQPVKIDLNRASELMQNRCTRCHNLDRVIGARKDSSGWTATVNRMRALPSSGISEADAQTIVAYLTSQNQPQGSQEQARLVVGRALVDQRCSRCHSLERVYKTIQTREKWRDTVTEMAGYAAGSAGALQPGEDRQILEYLAATQTPEAANRRKAETGQAAKSGTVPAASLPSPETSRRNYRSLAFVTLVCVAAVALMVTRPGPRVEPPKAPPLGPQPSAGPLLLKLVAITPQTHDSKTLRFALCGDRKLEALPGQFLTFSFLFDGRKETRCYSICSSPARTGYVEITPKRVPNGCVSVYLNDRASVGMTVEATGPAGQFVWNPSKETRIVLIAGGSGVTPMMAMLRYMDDLCLDTQATLLYCVRTRRDIIFHCELEELQNRLKGFRYRVLLSQPDSAWTGPPGGAGRAARSGHISLAFVREAIGETEGLTFFLCGPPPFMQATRSILKELGAKPEQIRSETFGTERPKFDPATQPANRTHEVEFVRSGARAAVTGGQTLLEAASIAGVAIPSACRQGQCGTCKTRLIAGEVHMAAEQGLDPESKARGFVLACVGYPAGRVTLDA